MVVGYPTILASYGRGASVGITYQEGLQSKDDDVSSKGNRNDVDKRILVGVTDRFRLQGRRNVILEPFWYRCWRYMELDIQTSDQALELNALTYRSTGYPLELKATFEGGRWINRLVEPGFRTMELCAGETYMDCPYYEQLQYIGDTRIQALLSYVLCNDDRLVREAIDAFDRSRVENGLTSCSYPDRRRCVLPLFSLVYIAMLRDFLMWRGDTAFVQERIRGVDTILSAFAQCTKDNGLIGKLPGWVFVDWTKGAGWEYAEPLAASQGNSFLVSFFYLYALQQAVDLYRLTGNETRADQIDSQAILLRDVLRNEAFDVEKGMFVDDPGRLYLSQHTNILAILTDVHLGVIDGGPLMDNILNNAAVAKATVYFKFYLYEAMYHVGRADLIWSDLQLWHDMLDSGLTTFVETPEPSRSDCHAWSSHPLYHFFASILGVRPSSPGCGAMVIRPACPLNGAVKLPDCMGGSFMTPHGRCSVSIRASAGRWQIDADFPTDIKVLQ